MMEDLRPTLWLEDLEGHREPSLYYLSSEDDSGGPHLICDWNGAPTDYDEFDIDMMCNMIDYSPIETPTNDHQYQTSSCLLKQDSDSCNNQFPSAGNLLKVDNNFVDIAINTGQNCTNVLTEDDGCKLEFLTVPPLVISLLNRQMKMRETMVEQEEVIEMEQPQPFIRNASLNSPNILSNNSKYSSGSNSIRLDEGDDEAIKKKEIRLKKKTKKHTKTIAERLIT